MRQGRNFEYARHSDPVAAGQTDVDGSSVDMQEFEGVVFIVSLGGIDETGTVELRVEGSSDNGEGDAWADIPGDELPCADDDDQKLLVYDAHRAGKRYLRPRVLRTTADATIDSITSIKYGPSKMPVPNTADVAVYSDSD